MELDLSEKDLFVDLDADRLSLADQPAAMALSVARTASIDGGGPDPHGFAVEWEQADFEGDRS